MSSYRINQIGGSTGFKVYVADEPDGLRVVGVFLTETDAEAWIARDRGRPGMVEHDVALAPQQA